MKKIFEHSNDLHVKARIVYVEDTFAYEDPECTKMVPGKELADAFVKGCLIENEDGMVYKPIAMEKDGNVTILTYVTADATTETTAVLACLYSKEYSE